jgi:predicted ATP-grasp superfamily ATP-dependent carboligase
VSQDPLGHQRRPREQTVTPAATAIKVLVTDAENKNALAAIRSLGRRGVTVVAGSAKRLARGFHSSYSRETVRYPSPLLGTTFANFVAEYARAHQVDVVLPIGDATTRSLSKHLQLVSDATAVPVAGWPAMAIASSKRLTMPFAQRVGLDVPRTFARPADVDRFPVVVKRSSGSGGVRYVNDSTELRTVDPSDVVIQEWIPGPGHGFFALFEHGGERATFMHRRIREFPITGGASTAAESFYDADLEEFGLRLLRALEWHGVAMVEVKRDARDGRFKLMEINPKFWGSLDLSIAAGVDFPWATVQMALGGLDGPAPPYDGNMRFQWVFDDLMRAVAEPRSLGAFWRDLRNPRVRNDIARDDLRPLMFDAARTTAIVARRAVRGNLRRPHGEPHVQQSRGTQC